MKNLIILSGNPGSGKTTLSRMLEDHGFKGLRIDDFYLTAQRDPNIPNWFEDKSYLDTAYAAFEVEIQNCLREKKRLVIETTGVGNRWKRLLTELASKFPDDIVLIYLKTSRETALQRIHDRNDTSHSIKMSDEDIDRLFGLEKDTSKQYEHLVDAELPIDQVFAEINKIVST